MDACLCIKVWLDQQSQRYAIQQEAYVKKHNTHALNVAWIAWPLLLTSLNNRSLSCAEISCISVEYLAINRCEFERRCKSSKQRVPM